MLRAWRVSMLAGAMGAIGSACWFTAMALEPVANVRTLGLILGGLVVLALFGLFEARHSAPLVNMKTFTQRPVATTNLSTLLIGSAMISTFVLVPQLAQLPKDVGFGLWEWSKR